MNGRTAFLVRCSRPEAEKIRGIARHQRRTISGYVLHIVSRMLDFEEKLSASLNAGARAHVFSGTRDRNPGPRTAILVRCSLGEGRRIRAAARRQHTSITGLSLRCLRISWRASDSLLDLSHARPSAGVLEPTR